MDWLEALRKAVAAQSQAAVARELGVSPATVSQVLSDTYKAKTDQIEALVRGQYLNEEVFCPAAGMDISTKQCAEFQRKSFNASNPLNVELHRTCPTCPNRYGAD